MCPNKEMMFVYQSQSKQLHNPLEIFDEQEETIINILLQRNSNASYETELDTSGKMNCNFEDMFSALSYETYLVFMKRVPIVSRYFICCCCGKSFHSYLIRYCEQV